MIPHKNDLPPKKFLINVSPKPLKNVPLSTIDGGNCAMKPPSGTPVPQKKDKHRRRGIESKVFLKREHDRNINQFCF